MDVSLELIAATIYSAGFVLAFIKTDAKLLAKFGLALTWPLGPLAFIVTLSILFVVLIVAFPLVGVAIIVTSALLASLIL
tara:strand:+ start:333 stop:572 length:240 start_codon:yes stop_codon:yes gene_type:complete